MIADELMIGNIVTIDNENSWPELKGKEVTVIGIEKVINILGSVTFPKSTHSIRLQGENGTEYNQFDEFIQPIPLTPEILERCGFSQFRDNKDSGFTAYRLLLGTQFNISVYLELGKKADTEINNTEIDCYHLHQLQNLVKILTGKQLEVK